MDFQVSGFRVQGVLGAGSWVEFECVGQKGIMHGIWGRDSETERGAFQNGVLGIAAVILFEMFLLVTQLNPDG